MADGIAHISIGVAELQPALDFWVGQIGMDVVARRSGPDPELGRLWSIPAGQFVDQLLLATPGATTGQLHLVQFREPGPAVRAGAAATDLCAKNLDVNCTALPDRVAMLQKQGRSFRAPIGEYTVDSIHAREVQLPGHDGVNIVFIEILSQGFEIHYSAQGFAAVTSVVVIVPDTQTEAQFYRDVFEFDELMHHRIAGPGIEAAAGLPAGTTLDMRMLGKPDKLFGRMELITYEGVIGEDRFKRAAPPATGILRCGIHVSSVAAIARRMGNSQAAELPAAATIFGNVRMLPVRSPAGLVIDVFEVVPVTA